MARVEVPDTDLAMSRAADTSARFEEDQLLRQMGFTIVERPRSGPPVWVREGKLFVHSVAVRIAGRERREKGSLAPGTNTRSEK